MARLARRAPEQVATRELLERNGCAAHQTRLTGPAVDVDLASVLVDARLAPHGLGRVFVADGVYAAVAYPSGMSATRSAQIASNSSRRRNLPGIFGSMP